MYLIFTPGELSTNIYGTGNVLENCTRRKEEINMVFSLLQSLNYNIPTRIRSQDSAWSNTRPSKPTDINGRTAMLIIANAIENKEKSVLAAISALTGGHVGWFKRAQLPPRALAFYAV